MGLFRVYKYMYKKFLLLFLKKICIIKIKDLSLHQEIQITTKTLTTMTNTFVKHYTIVANSAAYGTANVEMTITFDNESNTSVITFGEGFVCGGQTTGYNGNGAALATNKVDGNSIKLYSLKALTKLGTNHITLYKSDEQNLNKQTRFICDLTMVAIAIKSDIYTWRKSLGNE